MFVSYLILIYYRVAENTVLRKNGFGVMPFIKKNLKKWHVFLFPDADM